MLNEHLPELLESFKAALSAARAIQGHLLILIQTALVMRNFDNREHRDDEMAHHREEEPYVNVVALEQQQ